MKKLLQRFAICSFVLSGVLMAAEMNAQCGKFADSADGAEAEQAHVLYRDAIKANNFAEAFKNWQIAYKIAPAADGKRDFHYSDGRKIYMNFLEKETDEAKKQEHINTILRLYDEQIQCYGNDAFLLGRKAYDMFYYFRSPYDDVLATFAKSIEKGGNGSEYIVLDPMGHIVVYMFTNKKMEKDAARDWHTKLNAIADHNIANNKQFGEQFKAAKASMNAVFAEIEDYIFDCDYFKEKLLPQFEASPDDHEVIRSVYSTLIQKGCDPEDQTMQTLKAKYEVIAAEINAELRKKFLQDNPAVHAKELYDAGDFQQAIAKYREAIEKETDPTKQGEYYFAIASIEFRKLDRYGSARDNARKAASLKDNWGRPYMLIGDMYATTARNCGDDFESRLAVIAAVEKYMTAKSVDSEVAEEANDKINRFAGSYPESGEAFMRGFKTGQSVKVGCWIGETVTLRTK